jgi:hypothetical protein
MTRDMTVLDFDELRGIVAKFIGLMLRRNGYVLEQVLSPLVVVTSPEHEELVALAPDCLTRWHAHHYRVPEAPACLGELIAAKTEAEHAPLQDVDRATLEEDVAGLRATLDQAEADSRLADRPTAEPALDDLLVRTRLG